MEIKYFPKSTQFWLFEAVLNTTCVFLLYSRDVSNHLWVQNVLVLFSFFEVFGRHKSFSWGHWYPCFGLLVMSALGFKARVDFSLACFLACALYLRFTSSATPTDWIEVLVLVLSFNVSFHSRWVEVKANDIKERILVVIKFRRQFTLLST